MPGRCHVGKAQDGQRAQMLVAEHRLEPAGQRRVGEHGVEIERRLGHGDLVAPGRDRAVEIGQRLGSSSAVDLGHEAGEQVEHAVGLGDEGRQRLAPVAPALVSGVSSSARSALRHLSAGGR